MGIIRDLWDIQEPAIEAAVGMSWMLGRSDGDKLATRGIKRFKAAGSNPAAQGLETAETRLYVCLSLPKTGGKEGNLTSIGLLQLAL